MAARAMWKARLIAGDVDVPVRMYAAIQDRKVHFRLLEPRHERPVKQRMIEPERGREVPREEIRRGYEAEPGTFVVLTPEELESLKPEPSREIRLSHFVPVEAIDHRWYDRPYYLGPDGDDEAYFALAEALKREDREGVAHWTMRNSAYVGALRWEGDYLLLATLRHPSELVPASALPRPKATAPTAAERKMAEQLVATLEGAFEPERYEDDYRQRLVELIHAKAEGKVVPLPKPARAREEGESLEALLERSVAAARKGGHAA